MSKAIITLEDTETGIHATIEFDPPAKTHGDCTNAQFAAVQCLESLKGLGRVEPCDDAEEEDF